MLKIKDNVDLHVLNDYDYTKCGGTGEYYCYYYYIKSFTTILNTKKDILIDGNSREILAFDYSLGRKRTKVKRKWIKDLIQAGLVEKVGDK